MPSTPLAPRRELEAENYRLSSQIEALQAQVTELDKERRRWFQQCQAQASEIHRLKATITGA